MTNDRIVAFRTLRALGVHSRWFRESLLLPLTISAVALAGMYAGYLLFHVLAELTSILVGIMALVVATTSRRFSRNNFFVFIGIGLGWCAFIDLLHMLTYKGMDIVPGADANTATQLWIAARGLQAFALLAAPAFLVSTPRAAWVHAGFGIATALLVGSIASGYFPVCYIEGQGLTAFKIVSEYVIIAALAAGAVRLHAQRALLS